MSAVEIELLQDPVRRETPPVLVLARQEGRRMALHPFFLVGLLWGITVAVILSDNGPRDAFDSMTAAVTFFAGVPAYFAANLVASRDRRAHSGELLAAQPVPAQVRTWALCLATTVPAGVALALVAVGHSLQQLAGHYEIAPGPWHLLMGPVTVLGGALLGVMVSRWLPVPGAAALVMVAMIAWNVWWSNAAEHWGPLGTYMSWARWNDTPELVGFYPGSPGWHVAYLLGLCAMAVAGALLPGAASRWRVLTVGALLTALTVVLGGVQLT